MIIHLTDQSIAEVHSNPLNRLVLPGWLQDFQQQLVDPTVLELQLFGNTEVAQSQAAVTLDLGCSKQTKEKDIYEFKLKFSLLQVKQVEEQ